MTNKHKQYSLRYETGTLLTMKIEDLEVFSSPEHDGVIHIPNFIGEADLSEAQSELAQLPWRDTHDTYKNARGMTIHQNHDTYALNLARGPQGYLDKIPNIYGSARRVKNFINYALSDSLPQLSSWIPHELSLHRYDDAEVGLSRHKDHTRFIGVIAIAALEGECDLAIHRDGEDTLYPTEPGDLILLRAPGVYPEDQDLRPEHAVINLRTPTRTSMMLRSNAVPDEVIPGFSFDN